MMIAAPDAQLATCSPAEVSSRGQVASRRGPCQWVHAVDHDLTCEAAQALDRRLGRGPGRRDHHDVGLLTAFDALLGVAPAAASFDPLQIAPRSRGKKCRTARPVSRRIYQFAVRLLLGLGLFQRDDLRRDA
jgi:hypothetical protein